MNYFPRQKFKKTNLKNHHRLTKTYIKYYLLVIKL
jgi:hypothetical protein